MGLRDWIFGKKKVYVPRGTNEARDRLGNYTSRSGYLTPENYGQHFFGGGASDWLDLGRRELAGEQIPRPTVSDGQPEQTGTNPFTGQPIYGPDPTWMDSNNTIQGASQTAIDAYDAYKAPIDFDYREFQARDGPEWMDWQASDAPDFYDEYAKATGAKDYGGSDIKQYVDEAQDSQQKYLQERFDADAQRGLASFGAMGLGSSSESNKLLQQNQRDLAEITGRYGADAHLQGLGLFYDDRNQHSNRLANVWSQQNQMNQNQNLQQNAFNLNQWQQNENKRFNDNQAFNQFGYNKALNDKNVQGNIWAGHANSFENAQQMKWNTFNQPLQTDVFLGGGQAQLYDSPGILHHAKDLVGLGTGIKELIP